MLRCEHIAVASYLGFGTLQFSGSLWVNDLFLGALCPSKSVLVNKHIVKHIGTNTLCPNTGVCGKSLSLCTAFGEGTRVLFSAEGFPDGKIFITQP